MFCFTVEQDKQKLSIVFNIFDFVVSPHATVFHDLNLHFVKRKREQINVAFSKSLALKRTESNKTTSSTEILKFGYKCITGNQMATRLELEELTDWAPCPAQNFTVVLE